MMRPPNGRVELGLAIIFMLDMSVYSSYIYELLVGVHRFVLPRVAIPPTSARHAARRIT